MSTRQQTALQVGSYVHAFPVVRGIQSGREYYVTMCPLSLIPKLFLFDEVSLPVELRAQRAINRARIPEIARYIVQNPRSYTFSAITASVDSEVHFEPMEEYDSEKRIGILQIPMTARLVINDGQHRKAAIADALELNPHIGHETIPVVLFVDAGLKRSQQMFADLNKHAVRPSRSLGVLYDHRDPLAGLVRELIVTVPLFQERIEKEKTSISHRSVKLFTLSSVYQATKALLGKKKKQDPISQSEYETAKHFWIELPKWIPEWSLLVDNRFPSAELRRDYVHAHGVVLQALGTAGNALISNHPSNWKHFLARLKTIDWQKTNPDWAGRAIVRGRLSKAHTSVILATNYIKEKLGLDLTSEEERVERQYSKRGLREMD